MNITTTEDPDQLVRQAQTGDRAAFEALVEQQYEVMLRFAIKIAKSRTDAEDITQQSCIKLARGIRHYRFDSAFSTWMYQLILNCARDYYRKQREVTSDVLPEQLAEDSNESSVLLRQVSTMIDNLGEGFKETVSLVVGEGLTHQQTAQILGVKESTISWRMHEMRKHLKPLMSPETSG